MSCPNCAMVYCSCGEPMEDNGYGGWLCPECGEQVGNRIPSSEEPDYPDIPEVE